MSPYSKIEESDDIATSTPLYTEDSFGLYDEEHSFASKQESVGEVRRSGKIRRQLLLQVLGCLLLCVCSFFAGSWFRSTRGVDEVACVDTAWNDVREGIAFKTQVFNPRFTGPPSPFMGEPNGKVDRLWYDLSELRNFEVEKPVLQSINRSMGAVEFPGTGRYQVALEAFHHLHCLNYIRMYTYMDYYEKIDFDMVAESLEERRSHKDHCVEALRQRLMCSPDMNIYTYHWVNRYESPWGNLFASHRCIDWDRFHNWAQDNLTPRSPPKTRPEGAEVWD